MPADKVVTRFAPSPTGYLHIGGARTALFNWAFARRHLGTFILRIEDTDKARSTDAATRGILEDLRWLGVLWDEGPAHDPGSGDVKLNQISDRGPYFQSQRDHLYKQYLSKLLDTGHAYPDGDAYRFKMPKTAVTVDDLVLGPVTIQPENLEDFIIMKGAAGGGGPTFHFANVVDDATMKVTHVLRAQEHLMNTPKHVAMFDALGIPRPQYAHMPLIFNPDGSKMSKRDKAKTARKAAQDWLKQHQGNALSLHEHLQRSTQAQGLPSLGPTPDDLQLFLDKKTDANEIAVPLARALSVPLPEIDVHDFRQSGYLKDVLLNYVALLGWSPGNNLERFDLDYLRREFDLERLGKSNSRFDRAKLLAFNAETLQKMPPEEYEARLREHWQEFHPDELAKLADNFPLFAKAYQPRGRTLSEPLSLGRFVFLPDDAITFDTKAVDKTLKANNSAGLSVLRTLREKLALLPTFDPPALQKLLDDHAAATGLPMGQIAQPLRVALTGSTVSPAIHDTLAILGRSATLARIDRCLATIAPHP
ncbi:MAG: glutamate--tRNA ligase [Phycisphaeraceae bacterium]|nr:glutamate--tRNA ligase [Phycisphaeraceae bacterium]